MQSMVFGEAMTGQDLVDEIERVVSLRLKIAGREDPTASGGFKDVQAWLESLETRSAIPDILTTVDLDRELGNVVEKTVGLEGGNISLRSYEIKIPSNAVETQTEFKFRVSVDMDLLEYPPNLIPICLPIYCGPGNVDFSAPISIKLPTWVHQAPSLNLPPVTVYISKRMHNDEEWRCVESLDLPSNGQVKFQCIHFCSYCAAIERCDVQNVKFKLEHILFKDDIGTYTSIHFLASDAFVSAMLHYLEQNYDIVHPPTYTSLAQYGDEIPIDMISLDPECYRFTSRDNCILRIDKDFYVMNRRESFSFLLTPSTLPNEFVEFEYVIGRKKFLRRDRLKRKEVKMKENILVSNSTINLNTGSEIRANTVVQRSGDVCVKAGRQNLVFEREASPQRSSSLYEHISDKGFSKKDQSSSEDDTETSSLQSPPSNQQSSKQKQANLEVDAVPLDTLPSRAGQVQVNVGHPVTRAPRPSNEPVLSSAGRETDITQRSIPRTAPGHHRHGQEFAGSPPSPGSSSIATGNQSGPDYDADDETRSNRSEREASSKSRSETSSSANDGHEKVQLACQIFHKDMGYITLLLFLPSAEKESADKFSDEKFEKYPFLNDRFIAKRNEEIQAVLRVTTQNTLCKVQDESRTVSVSDIEQNGYIQECFVVHPLPDSRHEYLDLEYTRTVGSKKKKFPVRLEAPLKRRQGQRSSSSTRSTSRGSNPPPTHHPVQIKQYNTKEVNTAGEAVGKDGARFNMKRRGTKGKMILSKKTMKVQSSTSSYESSSTSGSQRP